MNGRAIHGETPEERLAAVAKSTELRANREREKHGVTPSADFGADYADYRDDLRPFVKRELLLARLEEIRLIKMPHLLESRVNDLLKAVAAVDDEIKKSRVLVPHGIQ